MGLFFVQLTFEPAHARNDKYLLPIGAALQSKDAQETPDGSAIRRLLKLTWMIEQKGVTR